MVSPKKNGKVIALLGKTDDEVLTSDRRPVRLARKVPGARRRGDELPRQP